jgi:hypothetical protein
MMLRKIAFLSALVCVLLTGCATGEKPQTAVTPSAEIAGTLLPATQSPAPTVAASPSPTRTPTPRPEPRTQYDLSAVLNYWGHTLTVDEQIDFTNNTPETLSEIPLVVEPLRYSGTFTLNSLKWSGGEAMEPAVDGELLTL